MIHSWDTRKWGLRFKSCGSQWWRVGLALPTSVQGCPQLHPVKTGPSFRPPSTHSPRSRSNEMPHPEGNSFALHWSPTVRLAWRELEGGDEGTNSNHPLIGLGQPLHHSASHEISLTAPPVWWKRKPRSRKGKWFAQGHRAVTHLNPHSLQHYDAATLQMPQQGAISYKAHMQTHTHIRMHIHTCVPPPHVTYVYPASGVEFDPVMLRDDRHTWTCL